MKTYLRCVYTNKFTLTGYLLTLYACFAFMHLLKNKTDFSTFILLTAAFSLYYGIISLALTSLGKDTLRAYRRSIEHVKKNGMIDERYENKNISYCSKCGIRLAKYDLLKL